MSADPAPADTRPIRVYPSRDWTITVECTTDGAVIAPGGIRIGLDDLAAGRDSLRQTVQQMIVRRQAMVRPGEPPYRAVIQFRVRPDGLRAYHLAYPMLEPLRVPMTRENLRPEAGRRNQAAGGL